MNIVKDIDQFDEKNIYFTEPIKNNIINNGHFVRILYSTPFFVINGIHILFSLSNVVIEKYFNKYKCIFNVDAHNNLIHKIKLLEETIIKKCNLTYTYKNKIPQYKLFDQIKNGNIKIFTDNLKNENSNTYILKISGIWHTDSHYGITYKFSRTFSSTISSHLTIR